MFAFLKYCNGMLFNLYEDTGLFCLPCYQYLISFKKIITIYGCLTHAGILHTQQRLNIEDISVKAKLDWASCCLASLFAGKNIITNHSRQIPLHIKTINPSLSLGIHHVEKRNDIFPDPWRNLQVNYTSLCRIFNILTVWVSTSLF